MYTSNTNKEGHTVSKVRGTLTSLSRRFLPCLMFARNVMQRSHYQENQKVFSTPIDADKIL
ncbi:MAG: hypothetical protein OFPII_34650 [Osedax symbiont Rs1]|nr:MAG: hypothetical protein OFPII_34650 [Osedax symbiont Rs1]